MKDTYKDYTYLIVKNENTGAFCAYVKLDPKHPWTDSLRKRKQFTFAGKTHKHRDYDSIEVKCHGGLTFGDYFSKPYKHWNKGYWIGWDYAHAGDYMPMIIRNNGSKVWKEKEVVKECKSVINQAIKACNS
jgi:hypothetical protein